MEENKNNPSRGRAQGRSRGSLPVQVEAVFIEPEVQKEHSFESSPEQAEPMELEGGECQPGDSVMHGSEGPSGSGGSNVNGNSGNLARNYPVLAQYLRSDTGMIDKVGTTATPAGGGALFKWYNFSTTITCPIAAGADTMVVEAVTDLAEEGGSTLETIKVYIEACFDVDTNRFAKTIDKALITQLKTGRLTKGRKKFGKTSFMLNLPNTSAKPKSMKKVNATTATAKKLKKAGSDGTPKLICKVYPVVPDVVGLGAQLSQGLNLDLD